MVILPIHVYVDIMLICIVISSSYFIRLGSLIFKFNRILIELEHMLADHSAIELS